MEKMIVKNDYEKGCSDGLTCGIALAAGIIYQYHGEDTIAKELLRSAGIHDKKELIEAGVDQVDLDNIGDLLPDVASIFIEG